MCKFVDRIFQEETMKMRIWINDRMLKCLNNTPNILNTPITATPFIEKYAHLL